MGHSEEFAQPAARAAGHLLAFLDEHEAGELAREVSQLVCAQPPPASRRDDSGYSGVLAWMITTIAAVLSEPLQWSSTSAVEGRITLGMFEGHDAELIEATVAVQSVVRAVTAALVGDDAMIAAVLDYADYSSSAVRVDILLEAVALLDDLLDARLRHAEEVG
jgi:hypothetical protein